MKNVIFSIYVDIDDKHLETLEGYRGDDMSRSHRTKQQLSNYKQQLIAMLVVELRLKTLVSMQMTS